jgi:hypothetical protein
MLELTTGQTNEKIIVTLSELTTLAAPNYLFIFEHITTKNIVALVMGADESLFPERFNQFEINTMVQFADQPPGKWNYTAYEQASPANKDPLLAVQPALEYGQMNLYKTEDFDYDKYNEPVTYKSYNG